MRAGFGRPTTPLHCGATQAPSTHFVPSEQTIGVSPTQAPDWHVPATLHASPAHAEPSATGTCEGLPPRHPSSVHGLPSSSGAHSAPPVPVVTVVVPEPPPEEPLSSITTTLPLHPEAAATRPCTSANKKKE